MESPDNIVVGGGIAGLAVAWQLALRGARVWLLEQEPLLGVHSTGRNAAIWLPTEHEGTSPSLTRRSTELLDALLDRDAWLTRTGALVTAPSAALLHDNAEGARASGATAVTLDVDEAIRLAPALAGGTTAAALHVPEAGVLDIHAMTEALARAARGAGVLVKTGTPVMRILREADRVRGVELDDGSQIAAAGVTVAGGAWASALGATCGAEVAIVPLRRHLVILDAADAAREPIVWNVDPEVYYRPESGGLLASPCDEAAFSPCVPPVDGAELDVLASRLTSIAPSLAGAKVRRSWACLRTYTADRELVAGPDPRVEGLAWLAGLGGRGMTIGPAAGELTAALLAGEASTLRDVVSPGRL